MMSDNPYLEKMKKLAPLPEDMRIYWVTDTQARVEAKMPYCLRCIKEGKEIVAALDDFAQIIGSRAKIVPDDDLEIAKALALNAAVLVDAEQIVGAEYVMDADYVMDAEQTMDADGWLPISGSSRDGKTRRDQDYVVTAGRDPYEAFVALTVLEKAAEITIMADALGGVKPIPERTVRKLRQNYLSKYSKAGRARRDEELADAADMEPADALRDVSMAEAEIEELKERRNLVTYGNKLIEKGLVQGTWGNISVRLDAQNAMLVTPSGLDYDSLDVEDLVKVDLATLSFDRNGNKPTTELNIHAGIYDARPDVGAIIHTHSKYCSLFAACKMPIDVKDQFLAEEIGTDLIYISDYAQAGSKELTAKVVKALGGSNVESDDEDYLVFTSGRKGCIMSNHGMIACAADLDTAMEVALAMEEAARKLINERIAKVIEAKTKAAEAAADTQPAEAAVDTQPAEYEIVLKFGEE